MLIRFNGYNSRLARQYVVKAMAVFISDVMEMPFITFVAAQTNGLLLRVTNAGQALPQEVAQQIELMIEVSQFEAGAL